MFDNVISGIRTILNPTGGADMVPEPEQSFEPAVQLRTINNRPGGAPRLTRYLPDLPVWDWARDGKERQWGVGMYDTFFREGYNNCVIAYRCVNEIAESFSQVPWVLYRKTPEGRQRVSEHDLIDLLEGPNPWQGGVQFRTWWCSYLQIGGESFINATRDSTNGQPLELRTFRPDLYKLKKSKSNRPLAWVFQPNPGAVDGEKVYPIDSLTMECDVQHTPLFNPDNSERGQSPMVAGRKGIETHNAYADWNRSLLDNAAIPSGALTLHDELGDKEYEDFKLEFQHAYTSSKNARRPMILEGGMTWVPMSFNPSDMDWLKGETTKSLDVCRAYGVPGPLLSITDPTYNNYKEARIAFLENRIVGLLQLFRWEMNSWLVPMFQDGSDLELDYDLSQVPAFAERRDAQWDRAKNSGEFLTVNERRVIVGFPPIEGGDVIMVPAAFIPLNGSEMADAVTDISVSDASREGYRAAMRMSGVPEPEIESRIGSMKAARTK